MIRAENLWKSFNGKPVLRGASLEVEKGEIIAVIGGSGSGKTVFLKHLIGLLRPDRGEVFVGGEPIFRMRERQLENTRRLFGFVFQSGALLNSMTVGENIGLPLAERGKTPRARIREMVKEKLEMVELSGIEGEMPSNLSGGMKKRAAIARAIIENPRIMLYDEPTAELDPVISRSMEQLIRSLKTKLGVTSVVVIHDMHIALRLADRIAMLDSGRFLDAAAPSSILKSTHPLIRSFIDRGMSD